MAFSLLIRLPPLSNSPKQHFFKFRSFQNLNLRLTLHSLAAKRVKLAIIRTLHRTAFEGMATLNN